MSDSDMKSVWELISEYELEMDPDSTKANLTCGICKKLMIDACQTACGCQYCYRCISEYLADGDKYCPGQKEDCNQDKLKLDKHVFKNSFLNGKILITKVRCPNEFCTIIIVLKEMREHLRVCTKQLTKCPYFQIGCDNGGAPKDDIVTHLQNETFTHSQLLIELIHNLKNEVDGLKDHLALKDLQMSELMVKLDEQSGNMIVYKEEQKRELECVKEELKDTKILMGEMTVQIEEQRGEIKYLKEESQKKENVMTMLKEELGTVKSEMELGLSTMKSETDERETRMEVQRRSTDDGRDELRDERMNKWIRWNKLLPIIDVDFVWKIDQCSKRKVVETGTSEFSESFHSNNYKLCLTANVGDNIYLYCHILKGDNDDKLQWPMRLSITVGIFNRDTLSTFISDTTQYDTYKYNKTAFDRPKTERNNCGIRVGPLFKYSSGKHDKSIVVDDSIIVSCVLSDRT